LNFGDAVSTVENTPDYYQMADNERSFLQVSMTFPNPVVGENPIRIMIFGNPGLIGMLKTPFLDVFVDATFDCTPHPFLQCLIFMIYDHSTSSYVPILYALMTSKCTEAYWHVFNQIVAISQWTIKVCTYCTDFEVAMMKEMDVMFGGPGGGTHIGCFFHLKQAWRKRLIEKCHLSKEHVTNAMQIGMLDLLCVLPHEQVEEYGIPYLRSILEKDASKKDIDKWQTFWNYFLRQWMPILWRWNISQKEGPDGSFFDVVNRTNNGLERYNRHFNRLFNKRPSLLEFVQIVEKESRFQDQKLNDIRYGRRKEVEREERTIPVVPVAYSDFLNLRN
jgi:hypothetical protein